MYQLPVRAKSADPSDLGTADCSLICHCDDGSDYAVKDVNSGKYVEHAEWFCKHLGDAVGIPSPECRIVDVDGELCFGSRWESGHEPDNWWVRIANGEIDKSRVCPTISRIFAFDLFINNIDRHPANYIVRPQVNDDFSFLAFDHSRAWMATGWPLETPPMSESTNTRHTFKVIGNVIGGMMDMPEALFVLKKLSEVKTEHVNQILMQQPDHWLSQDDRSQILNFWQGVEFNERIAQIEGGIKSGEYV